MLDLGAMEKSRQEHSAFSVADPLRMVALGVMEDYYFPAA